MAKQKKILLINTQFVERYVSGFTNRFIGLWMHIQKDPERYRSYPKIHWITNKTLWKKYFGDQQPPQNVTILSANLRWFRFTTRLFYPFFIAYTFYRQKCTSVHIATSIVKSVYLLRLFNFLKIPHCITFASNSVDMSAYGSSRMRKHWTKVLSLAQHVDVLNPTNSVQTKGKKHISPASFPYILEFRDLSKAGFFNPDRKNVILFCGSFVPQKNPLLAMYAFETFLANHSREYPGVELWMTGKGALLEEVKCRIKKTNELMGRQVIKLVPDTELIETLSQSKVFLSLQDFDNYPSQAIMEAMLFCNSVLSIDIGDTNKLVLPEKGNVLVPEKDPTLIASGIASLLKDWKLNTENRNFILNEFSADKFVDYFFKLHEEIIS